MRSAAADGITGTRFDSPFMIFVSCDFAHGPREWQRVSCCGSRGRFPWRPATSWSRAVEVSALGVELDARVLERTDQAVERPYRGRRQIVARALIFLDREPVHARTGGELLQRPAKQMAASFELDAIDPNCEHDGKIRSQLKKSSL